MQEYIGILGSEPERLDEWVAQPETWRAPMASPNPPQAETPEVSRVAFLFDKTYRLASARKLQLPMAINLQPVKGAFRKQHPVPVSTVADEQLPLKLFQPAQKRHYLVAASLICEQPGLPDCVLQLTRQEKVSFVVRRLLPPEDNASAPLEQWEEYAFVSGPKQNSWRRIGTHDGAVPRRLVAGEEQLPMFPVSFAHKVCGDSRKLFNGTIPVGRREQWVGAEVGADAVADDSLSAGRSVAATLLQADVVAPWKLLLEQAEFKKNGADKNFSNFGADATAQARERKRLLRSARDALQTGAWYVLLDLARFIGQHLPDVWQALEGEREFSSLNGGEQALVTTLNNTALAGELGWELVAGKPTAEALTDAERNLLELLQILAWWNQGNPGAIDDDLLELLYGLGWGHNIPSAGAPYKFTTLKWTLSDALLAAADAEQGLEAVDTTFIRFNEGGAPISVDDQWPDFIFPLADPDRDAPMPAVADSELHGLNGLERKQTAVDALAEMIEALLPPGEPADELMDRVPVGDMREAWFVIRCVYERPHCGPLFPALVSAATQKFQMAPFFDPDAPARPVRIPMPLDISPAGLRKYQKNTGFVISDMLCGKIKGIRKMSFADLVLSVLPWPFHKDLPDTGGGTCRDSGGNGFGMICSLSIPIVTLCALILMMIMVALFDLVFRWMPYLFTCLPIPGLKGKKA
ncbi:MAG: hypothetical protein U5S82_21075 [Gammaproteobacteria bacterium]|nr:hypothetical protein [Gammaproteobacteria bacterium]